MLRRASATIALAAVVEVTAGKGLMTRLLPAGQEVMNGAAREKTARTPSGVSKGFGTAATFDKTRINV